MNTANSSKRRSLFDLHLGVLGANLFLQLWTWRVYAASRYTPEKRVLILFSAWWGVRAGLALSLAEGVYYFQARLLGRDWHWQTSHAREKQQAASRPASGEAAETGLS